MGAQEASAGGSALQRSDQIQWDATGCVDEAERSRFTHLSDPCPIVQLGSWACDFKGFLFGKAKVVAGQPGSFEACL